MPVSECEECRLAEGGIVERIRFYRRRYFPTQQERIHALMHAYSGMTRALLGGSIESPYEKHKRRYIETGDILELERMARHVK